jgi:hypothetical protein
MPVKRTKPDPKGAGHPHRASRPRATGVLGKIMIGTEGPVGVLRVGAKTSRERTSNTHSRAAF